MLTVTVELLTGRYVATEFNDRSEPEWPPHPARLFSAAVAAWADHGDMDSTERAALEWWETLDPPSITCSLGESELAKRQVVTHFVPVNDTMVVARDTSSIYEQLVAAIATAGDAALDAKAHTKAMGRLEKATVKAESDSLKYSTTGKAPLDRMGILPSQRAKQARMYPTMVPADPTVSYHWKMTGQGDSETIKSYARALDGLLARIPRLGHSSTPVAVSLALYKAAQSAEATLEPGTARRTLGIRVASPGQVDSLIRTFAASAHATEPRVMPARVVAYRRPGKGVEPPASSIGERWLILEPARESRLMVRDVLGVAKTLRAALMSVAGESGGEVPEFLSGHRPRGQGESGPTAATTEPHAMMLGLPFAGHARATGELMGLAVVLPTAGQADHVAAEHWSQLTGYVDQFLTQRGGRLTFGRGRRPIALRPGNLAELPHSAQIGTWASPATSWVSVTPVALDRNPGNLGHINPAKRDAAMSNAEAIVSTACQRIGLPSPAMVEVLLDAPVRGTRPVHAFPPARIGNFTRVQVHARLEFSAPIAGPVVLGAGRFHGLGLFKPTGTERGDTFWEGR